MNKKNILWVSFRVPYDSVPHAGGKIHNFYLKKLAAATNGDIQLVSFYLKSEKEKIDLNSTNISNALICRDDLECNWSVLEKCCNYLIRINPFSKKIDLSVSRFVRNALNKIDSIYANESPKVVILQWTQIVSMLPALKRKFSKAKFVAIEEDVTFLSLDRRYRNARNPFHKVLLGIEEWKMKRLEQKCLGMADLTILNNRKDERLLLENGFKANIWVWSPFFQNGREIKCLHTGKNILFYGAMSRPENYLSAVWFLENVFLPKLEQKGFCFVVVGNKPNHILQEYDNGKSVRIVGFVDDVAPYFENSLCLVAPLVLGAGVKIKVIEAMSAGLPVLTNEIGVEGIYAEDGKDFFFCQKPDDYEKRIFDLADNADLGRKIAQNAKEYVRCNYNYESDATLFCDKILMLENE